MKNKEIAKIEPGYQIGQIEVISDTLERKNGYKIWICKCKCGKEVKMDTRTLQRGARKDCGCITKVHPRQRDLTGQKFGKLKVLEPTKMRGKTGAVVWKCQCECGNIVHVPAIQITKGYKKSCGCSRRPPIQDLKGRQIGNLTVVEYDGNRDGLYYWKCKCSCGKDVIVRQNYLMIGKTKSCGCLQSRIVVENMKFVDGTSVTLLEKASGKLISTNSSGHNGVYFNRKSQKWVAQIGFKGKSHYLGSYEKIEDAVSARKRAEDKYYGEFLKDYYHTQKKLGNSF